MATRERAVDRGKQRGVVAVLGVCREIRRARRSLGLSIAAVAAEVGISASTLSRIERGLTPTVPLVLLAQLCEVIGLELSARAFPGGRPLRDARQGRILGTFRALLHPSLRWGTEVPLPISGDRRGWDGMVGGPGWRYGVEVETNPNDGQATVRRIQLKVRDGQVDGVILVMPDTRQTRAFRREFAELLATDFPVPGRRALQLLAVGKDPGGSALVILSGRRAH
jgi:transcriptional regulator with XRE-family HTH domain